MANRVFQFKQCHYTYGGGAFWRWCYGLNRYRTEPGSDTVYELRTTVFGFVECVNVGAIAGINNMPEADAKKAISKWHKEHRKQEV